VEASGVYGDCANVCPGVRGSGSPGVHGEDRYGYGDGVSGTSTWGRGVVGTSTNGHGVFGKSTGKDGVHGESTCCSGVLGQSTNGVGVYGYSANSSAGFFEGNVIVTGTLSKGAGAFKIDHPLDPAHKYLQHSFVESPEMMNVYNGNVRTNAKGFATVRLPAWFQALNADFRYQLTVIDRARWTAHAAVWNKVAHNRFTIRTDQPSVEVSWQLTGIRHDAYANAHRIQVVVPKEADERGKYLHPDVYRQPEAKRIGPR
jgi:hypothetical protein